MSENGKNDDRVELEVDIQRRTPSSNPWARAAEAWAEAAVWLGGFAAICVIVYLNVRY